MGTTSDGVFVWDEAHGLRSLRSMLGITFSEWQTIGAEGISDDGTTLIGSGRRPSGDTEAWVTVLPEPSALGVLALGGVWASRRRQHRGCVRSAR